jgi:hypothetical protein
MFPPACVFGLEISLPRVFDLRFFGAAFVEEVLQNGIECWAR